MDVMEKIMKSVEKAVADLGALKSTGDNECAVDEAIDLIYEIESCLSELRIIANMLSLRWNIVYDFVVAMEEFRDKLPFSFEDIPRLLRLRMEQFKIKTNETYTRFEFGEIVDGDCIQHTVQAHWIRVDDTKCKCSACDVTHLIAQYPSGEINYCPNCGSRMAKESGGDA